MELLTATLPPRGGDPETGTHRRREAEGTTLSADAVARVSGPSPARSEIYGWTSQFSSEQTVPFIFT